MNDNELSVWSDDKQVAEVKAIYGKDLTDSEFNILRGIGKATGLNPFLREVWAVKYGTSPASIFVGRDGYRKAAQGNIDYDFHLVDAVYTNDDFTIEDGVVKHTYKIADRGSLVGAYCTVKRKGSTKATFTFVELKEYYAGNKDETGKVKVGKFGEMKATLWDTKPATMIKKVAEAQGLRMAFQSLFGGTYDESEQWEEKAKTPVPENVVEAKVTVVAPAPVEVKKAVKKVYATSEQFTRLSAVIRGLQVTVTEVNEWVKTRFGCALEQLKESQAETLIEVLELRLSKKQGETITPQAVVDALTRKE